MQRTDRPIVVALGGNAISPPDKSGSIPEQFETTRETVKHLAELIERGAQLLITHGNGPQVGNVLRRVELAAHEVYTLPLDICVADTQGGMGYMIATCLNNELRGRGLRKIVSAVVTTVEVDRADSAFTDPSKPIGGYYGEAEAQPMIDKLGWQMKTDKKTGKLRRVVPSPLPKSVVEIEAIRDAVREGELIIAGGGGGVPVARDGNGDLVGVEAVIDKDRTSALLAREINAGTFVIATGVRKVALNFGEPNETWLDELTVSQAREYLASGEFPPGSMGPKIEAAIDFLDTNDDPEARVIISDLENLADALDGKDGTWLKRG